MIRWRKNANGDWHASDKSTRTMYSIIHRDNGRVQLCIVVFGVNEAFLKEFATIGAAKAWVTKNFA